MKHLPSHRILAVAAVLAATSAAANSPKESLDVPIRYERFHANYVLKPDGSRVETREKAVRIVQPKAVEMFKQSTISYSTSVERAEVLEAYTLKADGKRLDAPKGNYQLDINKGNEGAPAFSDRTRLTVIFPDVAVGDLLVLKYRLTDVEPMFPGHFSSVDRFSRTNAYDDVKIRFEVPKSLWTHHAVNTMAETATESDGNRVLEWTWKNPTPVRSKRRDWSVYNPDDEVGYSLSTFRSYAQIAEAYGERARPKAAVTDRVRKLADELTAGLKEPRAQAKVLYEWVATNINYAGNCVGVGAVVPRDQAFVLDNKMGDCKDHATLLQALLAAKGITSTQALVNSGSTYQLPKVPVVSMVNHVILYVPSLNLYLDSTSETTPFGMLPMGDSDKPVLYVDGYRDGVRTPPLRAEANRQVARTEVTVKPDGSIGGVVQVSTRGTFAVSGRDRLRNVTPSEVEDLMERMYKRNGKPGFGKLDSDDPKPLADSFKYKVTFETAEFAQMPGPGAFSIHPLFWTEAPIASAAAQVEDEPEAQEIACIGGTLVEEFVYKLPREMKVLAVPKNTTASSAIATYKATYAMKGNTLTVRRELVDRTDRNVCPVSMQREYASLARKIAADLKSQVVYQ